MYSYNKEQCCGDDHHNLISVVMREMSFTIQEAMDYVGERYNEISRQFCEDYEMLPTFPKPVNGLLKEFCWGMGNWVTTNIM